MANVLKIKNSTVPGRKPADLESGEIAINLHDGLLFYKDSTDSAIKFLKPNIFDTVLLGQVSKLQYQSYTYEDIQNDTLEMYDGYIPPYHIQHKFVAETTYNPQTDTQENSLNIDSIEKIDTGEFKFNFISPFNTNTYHVDLDVQKFDDFDEPVNYGIVADKQTDYIIIKTGRTNISDINIVDRYDVAEIKIKLYN